MTQSKDTTTSVDPTVTQVRYALTLNEETKDATINVAGEGGVITLTGTVPSHETKKAAEQIAAKQEGVIEVINDLAVEEPDIADKLNLPPPIQPRSHL
jgi:osmotically-inducible protein OsmY